MWSLFDRLFGRSAKPGTPARDTIATAVRALDDGAAERALPTLVCRTCGLKYENTGTYLQGSRCPSCFPGG
jgi:predicted Zn-ribbon and HTH transcriptional regulator